MPDAVSATSDFVSCAPAMQVVLQLAHLYAPAKLPVILVGGTGTGKSLLARVMHRLSKRGGGFTDITVGELDQSLVRDQLFGHERGSFTGAVGRRLGVFAEAGEGTLLLDDFHNLSLEGQTILLRALGQGEYRPGGSDRNVPIRCRLMVGLREDPDVLVEQGALLPDLRYRLGYAQITIPGLEDRREDILPLAEHFLRRCPDETGVDGPQRLAPDVPPVLEVVPWPGNVRALQGVIRAAYLHAREAEAVEYEHLPDPVRMPLRFEPHGDAAANRRAIEWALWRTHGRIGEAAQLIGAHRNTVSAIAAELGAGRRSRRRRMHSADPQDVQAKHVG